MDASLGIFAIFAFFAGAAFVWLIVRGKQSSANPLFDLHRSFEERMQFMQKTMLEELHEVTKQVNERLRENMEFSQRSHQATSHAVSEIREKLAELHEQSKRIYDVGKDIASLQDILRIPKLRGILGEFFLHDILEQVLPKEHYSLQYRFASGEQVDAIIRLRDLIIPVDAKFPLENFLKYAEEPADPEKERAVKQFSRDIKSHIDAIAKKYIMPAEGTSDFALMYIPAEKVYYEVFVADREHRGLTEYAFLKRVIPVSPNSFYAYLKAILLGLKGMQIEQSAKEILSHLTQLQGDFQRFSERFRILGSHVRDAEKSYDLSERQLDRVGERLSGFMQPALIKEGVEPAEEHASQPNSL